MYTPSLKEFLQLSKQGNVIPIYTQINADLDTPVSAFLKLKKTKYAFLLESVEGQEKIARYSFLGSAPSLVFKSRGRDIEISYPQTGVTRRFTTDTDPLDEIKKVMQGFEAVQVPGLPRFYGGLVGYLGYDVVRFFEAIPDKNKDDVGLFDTCLFLTDTVLVFDHVNHTIKIVSTCILPQGSKASSLARKKKLYNESIRKIEAVRRDFLRPVVLPGSPRPPSKKEITSNFQKSGFSGIINRAKRYIRNGDIIQVVLSQRFSIKTSRKPFDIYRNLRSINPSPYMFFLRMPEAALVGASPEIHVRCEDGLAQIRPIAGTRPRGATVQLDMRMERDLLASVKEKAEHIMLVDLARNDLGRVCDIGKIKVSQLMNVERYSHVMHLVSAVEGRLRKSVDIYDLMRASFPAGTVSGSPKIRAMQIIDALEHTRRGTYAGCVGYFSFSHNMDTCITIRTIVVKDAIAYVQAGAGIVADSNPEKEYRETVNKAKALIEAITK